MSKSLLRKCREEMGLTLTEVAHATGMDQGNLSRLERGMFSATPDVAAKLARYYGYRISEMQILYPDRFAAA